VVHKKKPGISLDSLNFKNITYRLEVGYNNPARYGNNFSTTYFNGVKVGLTAQYPLKNNLSLLTGALYNLVYSDKLQKNPTSVNYLTYGHFINVPVQIAYTYPFSNQLKIFGYGGPTLNIGLSQIQGTISSVTSISSAYTNLYNSNLNRLDLQVGIGAGIQWKKYQLKGGYDYGVLNMNRLTTGKLYQKGWYVSLSITL
jgi:hypothetical protein